MTTEMRLVQVGVWDAEAKEAACGSYDVYAAAGTTQATATPIDDDSIINVTTVGAGSGVILANQGAASITVFNNNGTNALLVYPPLGGTINQTAANTGYSVAANKSSQFQTADGVFWVATHSA